MLWTVEALKSALARRVSLFERGVLTELEAAAGVLDASIFTALDHPQAWPEVTAALETVPVTLLTAVTLQLAATRLPDDGWRWPPIGAIGTPGGITVFRTADATEAAAAERLMSWLRKRVGHGARREAEPGAAPDTAR